MQDTDAFLTRTIVGAPWSARLGRRIGAPEAAAAGDERSRDVSDAPAARGAAGEVPAAAQSAAAAPPRRSGLRGWLERHALAVAVAGIAALAAGVALALFGARAWI